MKLHALVLLLLLRCASLSIYRLTQEFACCFQRTDCHLAATDLSFSNMVFTSKSEIHIFANHTPNLTFLENKCKEVVLRNEQLIMLNFTNDGNALGLAYKQKDSIYLETYRKDKANGKFIHSLNRKFTIDTSLNPMISWNGSIVAISSGNNVSLYYFGFGPKDPFQKIQIEGEAKLQSLYFLNEENQNLFLCVITAAPMLRLFKMNQTNQDQFLQVLVEGGFQDIRKINKVELRNGSQNLLVTTDRVVQVYAYDQFEGVYLKEAEFPFGFFTLDMQSFIRLSSDGKQLQVYDNPQPIENQQQLAQNFNAPIRQKLPICPNCKFLNLWFNERGQFIVKQDRWISTYAIWQVQVDNSWKLSLIVLSTSFAILIAVLFIRLKFTKKRKYSILERQNEQSSLRRYLR